MVAGVDRVFCEWWLQPSAGDGLFSLPPRRYSSDEQVLLELAALGWEPAGPWRAYGQPARNDMVQYMELRRP